MFSDILDPQPKNHLFSVDVYSPSILKLEVKEKEVI